MFESREWKKHIVLNNNKLKPNETNKALRTKFSPEVINIGFAPRGFVRLKTFWDTYLHIADGNQLKHVKTSVGDDGKWCLFFF
jgi:hypothetical protein